MALIPAVVIPIVLNANSNDYSNNHGWNITALEEKIKDKDTFIAYYGKKSCHFCEKITRIIKKNQTLKNAFSKFEKKHDVDDALHWFYKENKDKNKDKFDWEQEDFQKKLNKIVKRNGLSEIKGTPTWLFFKKGELVKIKNPLDVDVATGKPAKIGDIIKIDYEGTMGGQSFDGGSEEGRQFKLGRGALIDGFEIGLVGTQPGEEKTLKLMFPLSYSEAPNLAGKKVEFKVKIHKINKSNPSDQEIAQRLADVIKGF